MSELHVSQSNVNVLPEGLSIHERDRSGLHGGEASGSMLSRDHLSGSSGPTVDVDNERTDGFHGGRFPR